jgi:hypothetical protein
MNLFPNTDDASISPPPGVTFTPVGHSVLLRTRGLMTESTVPVKLLAVIGIDCSDLTYCSGVIGNGSAFCIKPNCIVKTHSIVKMSFAGLLAESFVFIRQNIPSSELGVLSTTVSKIKTYIECMGGLATITGDDTLIVENST